MTYDQFSEALKQNIVDSEYANVYSDINLNRLKHQINNPYAIGGVDQAITIKGDIGFKHPYGSAKLYGSKQLGDEGRYKKGLGLTFDLPHDIELSGSTERSGNRQWKDPSRTRVSIETPRNKKGLGFSVSRNKNKMSGMPDYEVDQARIQYLNNDILVSGSKDRSKYDGRTVDKGTMLKGEYLIDDGSVGISASKRQDSDPKYGIYFRKKF